MNILITGANRGIGLALTKEFLKRGDTVFAGTRTQDSSPALDKLEQEFGKHLNIFEVDVISNASVVRSSVKKAIGNAAIDVLINNAAVLLEGFYVEFEDLDLEQFNQTFEVNVTGAAKVTRACLDFLRRSNNPRIVNMSSGAGSISEKSDHGYYCYGASKAALNHLTVGLAHEFRSENIVVSAISPGWVRTDMGGAEAEISAEESATAMAETISNLSMKDSGKFMGRSGKSEGYVW